MSENRAYILELTSEAKEDLRKIDKTNASRIVKNYFGWPKMLKTLIMMLLQGNGQAIIAGE